MTLPTILALDIGERKMGTAVGSTESGLARPAAVWRHSTRAGDAEQIRQLARQTGATLLLAGLPLNPDGSPSAQAERIRRYAEGLAAEVGLPLLFWNEAYSSQDAQARLLADSHSRKRRRQQEDAVAAAIILQAYLDSLARGES